MLCEISHLLHIAPTIPVTSATAKRTFSALRRLKTFLRSSMTQPRLNHVMLLHIHKEKTDTLDLTAIAKDFISVSDRSSESSKCGTRSELPRFAREGPLPPQPQSGCDSAASPPVPPCSQTSSGTYDDDVSNKRNLQLLKTECTKPKPRQEVLKDLMKRTFQYRCQWI